MRVYYIKGEKKKMKTKSVKSIAIILSCLTIGLSAAGCTDNSDQNQNINNDKVIVEKYTAQIEYYSDLLTQLQDELLLEREEKYIEKCEYKLKIQQLEDNIKSLSAKLESMAVGSDISSVPNNNEEQISQISAKSEFGYSISEGKVTITSYSGKNKVVSIPEAIEGLPVVAIGEGAFKNTSITSVGMPEGIRSIDWFAFSGCTSLKEVTVPSSVTSVGYGAFDYCSKSLKILCNKGSYIEAYAASWGLRYESK